MSLPLVTWGFEFPSVSGGGGGGGGATGIRIHFVLYDDDGVPQPGIDLSAAGVVALSLDGLAYVNRHGSAPTSVADGHYYYETHADDGAVPPCILLKIKKAGYRLVVEEKAVVSPTIADVITDLASSVTAIEDSIATARAEIDTRINNQTTTLEADISAISSQITSAQSSIISEVDTRPTLSAIVSGVAAQVSADHGAGSYVDTGGTPPPTAVEIRDAIFAKIVEGSIRFDDAVRGLLSANIGMVTDFRTGTLSFKSMDGSKVRWIVTTDKSGRLSLIQGDLT